MPGTRRLSAKARIAALKRLAVLDTPPDEALDRLADLARGMLGVPVVLVSLLDDQRQFFKSAVGLAEPWRSRRGTPLSHSFCKHAVEQGEPLVIHNARENPLVKDNPAIAEMDVVAYLGVPLFTHDGQAVGTVCAIDREPRRWSRRDVELLMAMSTFVIQRLELGARSQDLAEARRAAERSESYSRALLENALDIVSVIDAAGVIVFESPAVLPVLGYEPSDLIGKLAFELVHSDDLPSVMQAFTALLADPHQSVRAEFRFRHRNGEWRVLEGIGVNLLADPAVGGIVFNSRDITDRRALELQLRQSQKMELVGELTAGIVHDFNNMLSVIMANADLMLDSLPADRAELRQDVEDVRAAARGGADMIRSLLSLSRRREVTRVATDLRTVLEDVARMLRRILPSAVTVEYEPEKAVPLALADAGAVEQMVLNLATNARDAMPAGGTLTLSLGQTVLDERQRRRHPWLGSAEVVTIAVRDTGIGMDEATRQRVFEPFFTTKPQGRGTGLGMAMVQGLVQGHEAAIEIESAPGAGTTVTVYLPAVTDEAPARTAPEEEIPRGSETLLLVEDEEAVRRSAIRILERLGYEVLAAQNGAEALDLLQAHAGRVRLVVSDVDMPRMDGRAFYRALRDRGVVVPFVLSTGFTARDLQDGGALGPEVRLLNKPWTLGELARTVREALDEA